MSMEVSCDSSGALKMSRISSGESATMPPSPGELATSCAWASTRAPGAPGSAGATSSASSAKAPARRSRRDGRIRSRASASEREAEGHESGDQARAAEDERDGGGGRGVRAGLGVAHDVPGRRELDRELAAGHVLHLAERVRPRGEGLVEWLAFDLAHDAERVRSRGGREEDGLVPARLAEPRLDHEVARLVADAD